MGLSDSCCNCCSRVGSFWYQCLGRWRLWLRPFVILAYSAVLLVLVPLLVINCLGQCSGRELAQLVGGIFTLMAIPLSIWEITLHLINYTNPNLQKHVIRILWLPIIYAIDAWLGLLDPRLSIYMNSLRECYESYVIYNFMKFLLNYLNGELDLEANLELKKQTSHFFPLCWLRDWEMGSEFVHRCKHGILQYTVIRPITAAIAFVCEMSGVYEKEGNLWTFAAAYPYLMIVNNFSQFLSMYCLVLFYKANKSELADMKPIGKFLCIKSVVFFSFFQEFLISVLANANVISNIFGTNDTTDVRDISSTLQNFLICIEMFIAAIAHHYYFSYKDYVDLAASTPNSCWDSFVSMWDVSDVKSDLAEHVGVVRNTVIRNVMPGKVYRHPGGLTEERARLLSISDGVDYQSGSESGPGVSSATRGPLQSAKSAGFRLAGEINTANGSGNPKSEAGNYDVFTDLFEFDREHQNGNQHF